MFANQLLVDASVLGEMFDLHPKTVIQLAKDGRIPGIRLSHRCWRFNVDEVLVALQQHNVPEVRHGQDG